MARGALDLADSRYASVRLGVDLLRPPALFPNMTGRKVRHGVDARRAVRDRAITPIG